MQQCDEQRWSWNIQRAVGRGYRFGNGGETRKTGALQDFEAKTLEGETATPWL